jgi:hypothetical protein
MTVEHEPVDVRERGDLRLGRGVGRRDVGDGRITLFHFSPVEGRAGGRARVLLVQDRHLDRGKAAPKGVRRSTALVEDLRLAPTASTRSPNPRGIEQEM